MHDYLESFPEPKDRSPYDGDDLDGEEGFTLPDFDDDDEMDDLDDDDLDEEDDQDDDLGDSEVEDQTPDVVGDFDNYPFAGDE